MLNWQNTIHRNYCVNILVQRNALRDDGLLYGERSLANELATEKKQKSAKNVLLSEAVNILGDEVRVLKADARLAVRVKGGSLPMLD
jgi:hypothetical protein